jgi:UDP-N-acetyl-D-glucosamine dehydrogenase
MRTRFIELAGDVNRSMPRYVIGRLRDALSRQEGLALSRAAVLLIGLAYKKNVDDMRESPSLVLYELLEEAGATVAFYDPFIPIVPITRDHHRMAGLKSIEWDGSEIAKFDVALIATDHDNVDYRTLVNHSRLVIDTRNICERLGIRSPKIVKA